MSDTQTETADKFIMIRVAGETGEKLRKLAEHDKRSPTKQVEYLIERAYYLGFSPCPDGGRNDVDDAQQQS